VTGVQTCALPICGVVAVARLACRSDDHEPLPVFSGRDGCPRYRLELERLARRARRVELLTVHMSAEDVARSAARAQALVRFAQSAHVDPLLRRRGARMNEQDVVVDNRQGERREECTMSRAELRARPRCRRECVAVEDIVRAPERGSVMITEHHDGAVLRVVLD